MNRLLLLAALPGALLAQTLEGTWQGTLTPPNQNDGIRLAFKVDKNGNTYQGRSTTLRTAPVQPRGHHAPGERREDRHSRERHELRGQDRNRWKLDHRRINQGTNPLPLPLKRATARLPGNFRRLLCSQAAARRHETGIRGRLHQALDRTSRAAGFNVTATELRARSISLADLITFTFELHPTQVSGLPGWAETEGYEIVAKLPQGGEPSDARSGRC